MKLKKSFFRVILALSMLFVAGRAGEVRAAASSADLFIQITRGGDLIVTGAIFSYIIELSNNGDIPAENTVVTITPPSEGMIIGTAQDGDVCLQVGDVLQCNYGSLGSLDSKTIEIQFQASGTATTMTLTAEVTTTTSQSVGAINTATIQTQVVDAPSDDDDDDDIAGDGGCMIGAGSFASAYWYLTALSALVGLRFARKRD